MKDFEETLKKEIHQEDTLPPFARKAFDQSYETIRQTVAPKKRFSASKWLGIVAAVLLVAGIIWQSPIGLAVRDYLGFGQFDSETVRQSKFVQDQVGSATDQGIVIQLEKVYADDYQMGISFKMIFKDHLELLKNLTDGDVSVNYRLKNGDGTYIQEMVADTKPLKGKGEQIFLQMSRKVRVDQKNHSISVSLVNSSFDGELPQLKDAVMEIEEIYLLNQKEQPKPIAGEWFIPIKTEDVEVFPSIPYKAADQQSDVTIEKAAATPTGFTLAFSYPKDSQLNWDNTEKVSPISLITPSGEEIMAESYLDGKEGQDRFRITTYIPYTGYDKKETLTLAIGSNKTVQITLVPK